LFSLPRVGTSSKPTILNKREIRSLREGYTAAMETFASKAHTFRAIDIPVQGGPEVLKLIEMVRPQPGAGEVLIEVHAAGVNRADCKQRQGTYPMPPDAPSVPGLEVSGIVAEVGERVARLRPGDRVCALTIGGGYAEYCVAPEVQCLPLPAGLDFVEAAALPEATFTVWMSVFEQARLAPGETILVHGGASGIGTTALQMARVAGARVFTTAGNAAKTARCLELGAELAVDYKKQDFHSILRQHLGARGIDVILDLVGGPYLEPNLDLLSMGGRLCYIAGDAGGEIKVDLVAMMLKRAYITGATLRHRTIADKGRLAGEIERRVWPWVERGALRPQVGMTFPIERAADAHRALEASEVIGKVVLVVRPT
jgi:putative PIG3 family NAD(P)H quinone oxidoreductase